MANFKSQLLWDNIEKGDLSAVHGLLEGENINLEERDENGQTFLMLASEKGELHIVRELLDAEVDVNAVDNDNWSALLCAAKEGHLEIVIVLLEKYAIIEHRDMNGWTALMWACYKGHSMVVQELLDIDANLNVKAEHNMTCLAWAAGRGYLEIVKMLIKKGAKINSSDKYGTTPLIWAARKGYQEIVELLLAEGANVDSSGMNSWTPLLVATSGRFVDVVRALLEYDPNINATDRDGLTVLAMAAKEGCPEIVHSLVAKGAYVNVTDRAGDTILIHAVKGGHTEIVKVLLNKYVDVDVAGSEGKTALYWSVEKGYTEITRLLLDSDPDLELSTKDGVTPLLRAVRSRNEECVKLLLDKGSRVSACDKTGDTALHIAIRARNKKITELLLRNPKNGRLLYRANKSGETPYMMDNYHPRGVLAQIFGHRSLNSSDAENLLGYEIYSCALADILSDPSLVTPITVGLYAKWGSGKSFLLGRLTDEMKSFTMQNVQEPFTFTWVLFVFLLIINVIIGEVLGLTVRFEVGLGVGLGLFVPEYAFLGVLLFCAQRYEINWIVQLSRALGRKLQILTLLLQTLFCNQQQKQEFKKMAEMGTVFYVSFLFSECTRLTSVGGEKYLAATIATLCDAVESEYSMLVTRLFRVFKPPFEKYKKHMFKTLCCIPYFIFVILFLLVLAVGIAIVCVYGISGNTAVNAVLITFASIIGLTLISNMFLLVQALAAIIVSQKARVLRFSNKIAVLKMDGFMEKLKEEVDLMSQMVNCMDFFTNKQTRLVIIVDGLDSCEQDKVLQVLDTVNALFAEDNSPFITVLAVDPHIIIKGIEQNLMSSVHDSNINGYDYLRNVVQLPFYLQAQNLRIQRMESVERQRTESTSSTVKKSYQHQDSTMSAGSAENKYIKRLARSSRHGSISSIQPFVSASSFDLSHTVIRNDYFSDINPRSMKRLMNIVAVTARLLRAYNIEFVWHRLMAWINIIEQWPYRVSWIIYYYEENDDQDNTVSLYDLYQQVIPRIPVSRDVNRLVDIDRDVRKLDAFLASKSGNTPLLNVGDLKKFLPVTINLDPFLRKLIREMERSAEAHLEKQIGFYAPVTRNTSTGTMAQGTKNSYDVFPNQQVIGPRYPMFNPYANQMMPYGPMGMMPYSYPAVQRAPPSHFIHDYMETIMLSSLSVDSVCNLLKKVEGIHKQAVPKYAHSIKSNNITGLVLANCDIEELGKVMDMTFGDWQLMKATILSLRQAEGMMELDQSNCLRQSRGAGRDSSRKPLGCDRPGTSSRIEKQEDGPGVSGSGSDCGGKAASTSLTEVNKPDVRKAHFKHNDSIVEQLTYESQILKEVLEDFTEQSEEEEGDENGQKNSTSEVRFNLGSSSDTEVQEKERDHQDVNQHHADDDDDDDGNVNDNHPQGLMKNIASSLEKVGKQFFRVLENPMNSTSDMLPLVQMDRGEVAPSVPERQSEESCLVQQASGLEMENDGRRSSSHCGDNAVLVMENERRPSISRMTTIHAEGSSNSKTFDASLQQFFKDGPSQEMKGGDVSPSKEVHVICRDQSLIPASTSVSSSEDKESFV
ncbi:kinase D-interacting substrate of 220 kDa B-like [Gigantopelta aegis]|uniref:kinase D-interacting substrate of 220 kDa B-like n=1 Tax=Gigantopelta aegis TaxID=1735272 RepID=UPI001B88DF09|nr:kinase D-interacting substrate of 220 kDa B-like [Gigantopelta aegis]XP_041358618.1 kinase D-interacting substrate of 220 kDa B-like [Gigantopelta aegis]